ncbi:AP complex, mu/sigma subunit [Fimicolochytrium jonesii]|uniref:AP complex, mu/sigma subunit n=1 Tax=Fimicolochytrium jonesii TaxID=1396493 RepID=UPI0022FE21A6|nr:AP complex, mu/sigma subunit [Fimicolochytrium jonesii]KAI8826858.1 AP complex, mu/sigma subunit [Fimicolochytrium jonesii]
MLKAVMIFNNHGKPRLMQWYQQMDVKVQQEMLKEIFRLVNKRPDHVCNFLEGSELIGGQDTKIIYRHYATLYFAFVVDSSESELGILDLIQVFVEALDRIFSNVCELDLIFRPDEVSQLLSEVISGGMVLETNITDIVASAGIKKITSAR